MDPVRHYLLALQFFTRIPVTGRLAAWAGYSPQRLHDSAAHLPGVGWLVGALAALVYGAVAVSLPDTPYDTLVAAVLSTVCTVWLTGAFHEDGLADVADGLGGSHERERALEIMKDSRLGTFGVLALVLALLSKVALLAALGEVDLGLTCLGLFVAHVVSRFMPLLLIRLMPYVGDAARSKSAPLTGQISGISLLTAGAWLLGALARGWSLDPDINWLGALLGALLAAGFMGRMLWRRLQGYNGDGLGATQQVCELLFYVGLLLSL